MSDGTVAAAPGKQKELWQLRERIAEALLKVEKNFLSRLLSFAQGGKTLFSFWLFIAYQDGYCYKYDISLPLSVFYDSVTVMRVDCSFAHFKQKKVLTCSLDMYKSELYWG